MDAEFTDFLYRAKRLGICTEYASKVNAATSKKQMFSLACEASAIQYMCESMARGWGLRPDYISRAFAPFLNGRYVYNGEGYSSAIYCQDENIQVKTTIATIINCDTTINTDRICELHIVNSKVEIKGTGRCIVYLYNSSITNADSFKGVINSNIKY